MPPMLLAGNEIERPPPGIPSTCANLANALLPADDVIHRDEHILALRRAVQERGIQRKMATANLYARRIGGISASVMPDWPRRRASDPDHAA